jgi:hypothetical protein
MTFGSENKVGAGPGHGAAFIRLIFTGGFF